MKKTLILIPARAGSKGLPGKNTKILGDIPLISHTLKFAQTIAHEKDIICVSSNDDEVIEIARQFENVQVPFVRPEHLSSDHAGTYDVILHALNYYEELGIEFEKVLLLQPTSPFRTMDDFLNIKEKYSSTCDMVVSVSTSKNSPYFNLFEQNNEGYLMKSKQYNAITRQECPEVYAFNGSFYLINVTSLKKSKIHEFTKVIKSVMPEERSIDIDNMKDWTVAEYFLKIGENENS